MHSECAMSHATRAPSPSRMPKALRTAWPAVVELTARLAAGGRRRGRAAGSARRSGSRGRVPERRVVVEAVEEVLEAQLHVDAGDDPAVRDSTAQDRVVGHLAEGVGGDRGARSRDPADHPVEAQLDVQLAVRPATEQVDAVPRDVADAQVAVGIPRPGPGVVAGAPIGARRPAGLALQPRDLQPSDVLELVRGGAAERGRAGDARDLGHDALVVGAVADELRLEVAALEARRQLEVLDRLGGERRVVEHAHARHGLELLEVGGVLEGLGVDPLEHELARLLDDRDAGVEYGAVAAGLGGCGCCRGRPPSTSLPPVHGFHDPCR